MQRTNELPHLLTYLFFSVLLSVSLIYIDTAHRIVAYIHVGILVLIFFLILRQLRVWKVKEMDGTQRFSSFFGLVKKELNGTTDLLSVEGFISYDPATDVEKGEHLILHTTQGIFRFHSWDYKDFDQLLNELFANRRDLRSTFVQTIRKQRKLHIDRTWIYYGISLVILVILFLMEK